MPKVSSSNNSLFYQFILETPIRGRPPKKKARTRANTLSPPRCAAGRPRKGLNTGGLEETPLHQIEVGKDRRIALKKHHIWKIEQRMEKVINEYIARPWPNNKKATATPRRRSSGLSFSFYLKTNFISNRFDF